MRSAYLLSSTAGSNPPAAAPPSSDCRPVDDDAAGGLVHCHCHPGRHLSFCPCRRLLGGWFLLVDQLLDLVRVSPEALVLRAVPVTDGRAKCDVELDGVDNSLSIFVFQLRRSSIGYILLLFNFPNAASTNNVTPRSRLCPSQPSSSGRPLRRARSARA